jgi:hypothetical protein
MDFNSIFFPAPKDRYSCASHFNEMFYLPKVVPTNGEAPYIAYQSPMYLQRQSHLAVIYIPCLYI